MAVDEDEDGRMGMLTAAEEEEDEACGGGGAGVEAVEDPDRDRSIQDEMCVARRSSELGRAEEGSSRWQTGHSSSSARRGGRGRGRSLRVWTVPCGLLLD